MLLQTAVALFLVSLAVGVCVASGAKETKYYTGGADPRASLAQKILIPVVIVVAAGVAAPLFLLSFDSLGKPRNVVKHAPKKYKPVYLPTLAIEYHFFSSESDHILKLTTPTL